MKTETIARSRRMIAERTGPAVYVAAGLSLLASLIHLWVAPEHFEEWWVYGVSFLAVAFAQGVFVFAVLRWPARTSILLSGIATNLAVGAFYVISRTWGMPFGPDLIPFSPYVAHVEDPEILGMIATAAEVGIIFSLVALLGSAYRKAMVNVLLLIGAFLWALRLTGILP